MTRFFAPILAVIAVAGCTPGGGATNSGFVPSVDAAAIDNLDDPRGFIATEPGVGRYFYVAGINPDANRIEAYAGIEPGAVVGPALPGGTATFNGRYGFVVAANVRVDPDGVLRGMPIFEEGGILLSADLTNGTLVGSGDELEVDGVISGTGLSGQVTARYSGTDLSVAGGPPISGRIRGTLDGLVGTEGVIGVYHGSTGSTALAGGVSGQPFP